MFRIQKSRRWNGFNFTNTWIDVFVAHCEIIRSPATLEFLYTKSFEFIYVIGSNSWVLRTDNFDSIYVTISTRFIARDFILWILDLTRIWQLIGAWSRHYCVIFTESSGFNSK